MAAGRLRPAVAVFERLVAAQPSDLQARILLGNLQAGVGNAQGALQTHEGTAVYCLQRGSPLKAAAVYKKMLQLRPSCTSTLTKLGGAFEDAGLLVDARASYEQAYLLCRSLRHREEAERLMVMLRSLGPESIARKPTTLLRLKAKKLWPECWQVVDLGDHRLGSPVPKVELVGGALRPPVFYDHDAIPTELELDPRSP